MLNENGVARVNISKAIFFGLAGAVFISIAEPYSEMMIKGSRMAIWNTTPIAVVVFFLLVAIVNVALRLIYRPLALTAPELAVAYVPMLAAATIVSRGWTGYLLPIITSAYYYATPENDWAELIHPYVPKWLAVQDREAVWKFYEGAPKGEGIPWEAWATPLFYWTIFGLALFFVMICISVILRKQWIERERLVYPMVQVPLAMIEDDDRKSLIKPLFRSVPMWIGFLVPALILTVNALHNYYPIIPGLSLATSLALFRRTISIRIVARPALIGFSYFISREIAFGLCFFHILNVVQTGVFNILGVQAREEAMGVFSQYTGPIILHQAMGAMIVLVLVGLWVGRGHLKDVCRKAFKGDPSVDDSGEMMSYRTAVFGCIIGFLVLTVWLWRSGIPFWIVPMVLFGSFVLFMTETRVMAEGGVAMIFPPMNGLDFVVSGVGTSALGATGLVGLSFAYIWGTDVLILLMAAMTNGLKMVDGIVKRKRFLLWVVIAAILITFAGSIGMDLHLAYKYGGINLDWFYFNWACKYPFQFMEGRMRTPSDANVNGWIYTGIGGVVMLGLMFARYRFLWWPFHPLGFPISSVFGSMWFSVFLAWIVKSVVLKYGGPRLYRSTRPFFVGLILGEFVTAGIWIVIDYFAGMTGNYLTS